MGKPQDKLSRRSNSGRDRVGDNRKDSDSNEIVGGDVLRSQQTSVGQKARAKSKLGKSSGWSKERKMLAFENRQRESSRAPLPDSSEIEHEHPRRAGQHVSVARAFLNERENM